MKSTFKFLVSIFAVLMIVSIISLAIPMSVTAATTGRDAAVAWANSQINKGLDLDGAYGNQCVDLIYYYYRHLGVAELGGNAVDYAYNTLPIGWRRISCTPGFVPQPGDIAVWRVNHNWGTGSTGEYGHIGIVVSGDESDFYAINQNHQGKTYCTKNVFPVSALHSVIRPDYSKIGQFVVVSYYEYPNLYSVTETNAVLATHVNLSKISNQGVSRAGIYLYDSDENLIKDCFWNAPFANLLEGTSLDISCNVNSELGKTLTPGTTYKYKFMIVLNGTTYYSPVAEFTTETSISEEKIDYEYTVNDDGKSITLTKYIGEGGDVVIPSEIDGYSVTDISKAFNNKRNITSVIIPDSVTSIENSAFSFCSYLESIKIPDSVTSIGGFAFNSCSKLNSIIIPDSVTNIGECAFSKCSGLVSIEIPDGVTNIEVFTFHSCSNLKSVTIPESVITIGNLAFKDCSSLTSIEIPNSVTSIGHTVFEACSSLKSVTIPESVATIGNYVFNNCSSLESVTFETKNVAIGSSAFDNCSKLETIYLYRDSTADEFFSDESYTKIYLDDEPTATPESDFEYSINDDGVSVTITKYLGNGGDVVIPSKIAGYSVISIGEGAFFLCTSLTNVTIPDSVTSIGVVAFHNCSSLTSVIIPDSVTSIGNDAFRECSSLTSVTIPDSVIFIASCAFSYCSSLTSIEVGENNKYYCDVEGVLFTKNMYTLLQYPIGNKSTIYFIPNSVTSIDNEVFSGCSSLTSVTIPDSVTSIGGSAFSNCSSLTSVTIPDSVTSIGGSAFYNCSSLTSVTIPDSVTSIGDWAFRGCNSLTAIEIDENNEYYCDVDGVLFAKNKRTLIAYSAGGATTYTIPDSVTSIGDYAFADCISHTSVTIPDSVTSIGDDAFYNCSSLTSVTIPDSVTSIGDWAFRGCNSLTSVIFKTKNAVIGYRAFNDCDNLETIYLYKNSTADEYFSDDEYTKVYLDEEIPDEPVEPATATIYTESKKSAIQGSEFTYKVYLEGTYDGYAFELVQPEGLTITNVEVASSQINADNNDGIWLVSVIGGLEKNESVKEEIVTVTVSVAKDAALGERVLSLSELFITNENGDMAEKVVYNYATITITDQIPGDINGDGKFNYTDVSKLYAYFRKKTTISENIDTDINGDGKFNYTDVSKLYAIFRKKADFN